ncbi:MAG: 2-C-methyl-D-erythritol 4-phosphate cytidylyltransferase [Mycobacteriaceae bacterium]
MPSPGGAVAVIPAAGRGVRLGEPVPKALVRLAGTSLLQRAVDVFFEAGGIGLVVLVVPAALVDDVSAQFGADVLVVAGGVERSDSVRVGLRAALGRAPGSEYVLVHDAARALTPVQLVRDVLGAVRDGADAVIPVLPVVDTIKSVDADGVVTATPDRARLRAVQTPQGFRADILSRAHRGSGSATDDAGLVERMGVAVHTIAGDPLAFKITTPLDLRLAQTMLGQA